MLPCQERNAPLSKLLIQEPPLQVLPSLACKLGLSPAIILQQLHYLMTSSFLGIRDENNRVWIKLSWSEWNEKYFPFWQISTIRSNMEELKDRGLVLLKQDFKDQKNGYSIDYEKLNKLEEDPTPPTLPESTSPCQNQQPSPAENQQGSAENRQPPTSTAIDTSKVVKKEKKNLTNLCVLYNIYSRDKNNTVLDTRAENVPKMPRTTNTQKKNSEQESWNQGRIELYRLLFAFKEASGDSLGLGHLIKEECLPESIPGRLKQVVEDKWKEWLKQYAKENQIGLEKLREHLVALGEYMKQRKPLQIRDKNLSLEELLLRPHWISFWMQEALSKESVPCKPIPVSKIEVVEYSKEDYAYPDEDSFRKIMSEIKQKTSYSLDN